MNARIALPLLAVVSVVFAACGSGGPASPDVASPAPSPIPIAQEVATPEEAAALVIAAEPRFAGTIKLTPDIIGASRWWESEPSPSGGFRISIIAGWGDCPAGCINRHTWTYDVAPGGDVTFVEESGDPIPAGGTPAG
jgi:hypothetical protein